MVGWGSFYGPTVLPSPNAGFIAIAAGGLHNLALKGNGSIVAWGYNSDGQVNVPSPNAGFIAVAAGAYHSLGLKADGSVAAWGSNCSGQTDVPSPNAGFIAIAGGSYHSLGLKADGSIVAWGDDNFGQTDVPSPNTRFVAIAAGQFHSLGLKGCSELGDSDSDGDVDLADLAGFQKCFGASPIPDECLPFDVNGDGRIGLEDYHAVAEAIGDNCGGPRAAE
jgi:hypothetical protein